MALRTDYKDDILDLTQNTQRKYRMITNADGTVSFEDVTAYSQVGDSFGAADINSLALAISESSGNIDYFPDEDMIKIKDSDGVWHDWASGRLSRTYLYDSGDENINLTGGWVQKSKANDASFTKNLSSITAQAGGSSSSVIKIGTKNVVDVSSYSTLVVKMSAYSNHPSQRIKIMNNETDLYIIDEGQNYDYVGEIFRINIKSLTSLELCIYMSSIGSNYVANFELFEAYLEK